MRVLPKERPLLANDQQMREPQTRPGAGWTFLLAEDARGARAEPRQGRQRKATGRQRQKVAGKSQGATTKKAVSWTGPSQSIHVWTAKEVKPIHSLGRWPGAQGGNLIAFLLAGMRAQGARGKGLPAGQDTIRHGAAPRNAKTTTWTASQGRE